MLRVTEYIWYIKSRHILQHYEVNFFKQFDTILSLAFFNFDAITSKKDKIAIIPITDMNKYLSEYMNKSS